MAAMAVPPGTQQFPGVQCMLGDTQLRGDAPSGCRSVIRTSGDKWSLWSPQGHQSQVKHRGMRKLNLRLIYHGPILDQVCTIQEFGFGQLLFFFIFIFLLLRSSCLAYGGSQATDRIGAIASSLCHSHSHSHSNTGTKLSLPPSPQFMATPDP